MGVVVDAPFLCSLGGAGLTYFLVGKVEVVICVFLDLAPDADFPLSEHWRI
jgi:hypothetical protein